MGEVLLEVVEGKVEGKQHVGWVWAFCTMRKQHEKSHLVSERLNARGNVRCDAVTHDGWYHRNTRLAPGAKRNGPLKTMNNTLPGNDVLAAIQNCASNKNNCRSIRIANDLSI